VILSYSKGRSKTAKYGRDQKGLAVYITQDISKRVIEISSTTREVI
jgi:hypothetical protein